MLLEYFMRFSLVYQIYQWNDVYGWPKSHLSPQNSWMRMYTTTGKRRDWRWKSKSNVLAILFFYTVRTSFWKAKEIRIRDKNMPIRHHYCTLLYLFVERVYVSFGVNRSFSTTWPTISMARCGTTGYYGRSMLDWHGQTRNYGPHTECRVTFPEWATESNPAGEPTRRENFRSVRLTLVLAIAFSCRT